MTNQPFQPYPVDPGAPAPTPGVVPKIPKPKKPWGLIGALVVFVLLFFGAAGFAVMSYASGQDYKNNSDKKAAAAVQVAVQAESDRKDNQFKEDEKKPNKLYVGPATFGSLEFMYPKTWSAFVTETERGSTPIDGYFHPNFVPGIQSGTQFALRVQVTTQPYDQELKQFESKVRSKKVTISAYTPKNVTGITGARVDGEINTGDNGSMVLIPLRDRTIKISTQSQQFMGDFNGIILETLKFVP